MKRFKKALLIILGVIAVLAMIGAIIVYQLSPDYNGEKTLTKLTKEVKVYYDAYGIPHIYGENEADAFRALGYVHAQDRLWQMELLRRIGSGGLSEVFGADLLETDKFFISLGINEASENTIKNIVPNDPMVQLSQAYLDGVNQFIDQGPTPVEFYLTGIKKRPFTLKDVYNTVGYMAFSFAMAHKTDPLLTNIKNKLGPDYLVDLEIDVDSSTVLIKNHKPLPQVSVVNELITSKVSEILNKLPLAQFEGSNSWVIAPEKTKNGKVIFANDPHIGFAQPSVWYEAHVSTPAYEKYGYHLAGVPFPLLGHNRKLAYGLTMFENDDIDFYFEEENPLDRNSYKTTSGYTPYKLVHNTIKVKDEDAVAFKYKESIHGPIVHGITTELSDDKSIAMSWVYTKVENKVMDALYGLSRANNLSDFKKALPDIHAPGLNIMYGDAVGNVAWFATAKLYTMPEESHTKFILDGSSGKDEPLGYLDFSENPMAVNPPWSYVYSANNQPDSIAGMLYPGYYLPENRAKRIVSLLEPKDDWDKQQVSEMILDVTAPVDIDIVSNLVKLMDVKQLSEQEIHVLDKLSLWDGNNQIEKIEPTVYHRWLYQLIKHAFEDELGTEMFQELLATHMFKRLIAPLAEKETSVWWDNITTKDIVETKQQAVIESFKLAVASLKADFGDNNVMWTWGKVHTLEHEHPIGRIKALRSFFNVGPFPAMGTREVINNMAFSYDETGKYPVTSGPSTRRVIDFSDIENSISILPTGQSGNPFSPHYRDQAKMFNKGHFRKMMMNKEEIISSKKSLLIFKPKL